jgi:hypothetical protein
MHAFSVELKSVDYLKALTMSKKTHESFLFEGFFGELVSICFIEGVMLKIEATHGTFSIELTEEELDVYRKKSESGMKGENRK